MPHTNINNMTYCLKSLVPHSVNSPRGSLWKLMCTVLFFLLLSFPSFSFFHYIFFFEQFYCFLKPRNSPLGIFDSVKRIKINFLLVTITYIQWFLFSTIIFFNNKILFYCSSVGHEELDQKLFPSICSLCLFNETFIYPYSIQTYHKLLHLKSASVKGVNSFYVKCH